MALLGVSAVQSLAFELELEGAVVFWVTVMVEARLYSKEQMATLIKHSK